jgi:hypothetical protein
MEGSSGGGNDVVGLTGGYIQRTLAPFCSNFEGVFSSDTLPRSMAKKERFSAVVNLSTLEEPGTHFISIHGDRTCVLYLDSVGLPCIADGICKFLATCGRPVMYNKTAVQHPASPYCGFYCILNVLALDDRNRERGPKIVFDKTNLMANDKRCIMYIKSFIL